jgi:hypothetical protein
MGKQPSPSPEELEFIFGCFARGLADTEVLDEMQGTEFPLRNPRFIRDRRKEFNATKRVLQAQLQKEEDPIISKRKEEHFLHLAKIAEELSAGNLNTVTTSLKQGDNLGEPEYAIQDGGWDSPPYPITKEQLSSILRRNIEVVCYQYTERVFYEHFLPHLHAEIPDIESKAFWDIAQEKPYELIKTLILLSQRKTFKGTCPVCKDW